MRALTLHQPYASAVALGLKRLETRGWSTAYRGPLVIHAAAAAGPVQREAWARISPEDRRVFAAAGYHDFRSLPLMRPVAVADLHEVLTTEYCADEMFPMATVCSEFKQLWAARERRWGDYTPGRFAWALLNVERVDWPGLPVTGYQGLWHWKHGPLSKEVSTQKSESRMHTVPTS